VRGYPETNVMTRVMFSAVVLAALGTTAGAADPTACTDRTAIRWHVPGEFEDARKEAEKEKRLLLIKGIAFGVDELGAKDATKGCW
jgi:hypothetical protein